MYNRIQKGSCHSSPTLKQLKLKHPVSYEKAWEHATGCARYVGRFPWKRKTVVHFTKWLLEEGWLLCSITMLSLLLHHRHSSVIITIWEHIASVSLERVLSDLWNYPWDSVILQVICIQQHDVRMYTLTFLHIYFRDMVQTSRANLLAGPVLLPPSIYLNRLTYSTATHSWESTHPLNPSTTDLNRTCGWH